MENAVDQLRRSGRQRRANPRYQDDIVDTLQTNFTPEPEVNPRQVSTDADFLLEDTAPDYFFDDENKSSEDAFAHGVDSEDSDADTQIDSENSERPRPSSDGHKCSEARDGLLGDYPNLFQCFEKQDESAQRSRGVEDFDKPLAKEALYGYPLGFTLGDEPNSYLKTRDQWYELATMPYRHTHGTKPGGLHESFWQTYTRSSDPLKRVQAAHLQETVVELGQRSQCLELDKLLQPQDAFSHLSDVVAGPVDDSKRCSLQHCHSLSLHTFFDPRKDTRRAFILDFGRPVSSLAWAPCKGHSTAQYLSISPRHSPSHRRPTTVEIWQFRAQEIGEYLADTIDVSAPPRLAVVLNFSCDAIRDEKWSPQAPDVAQHGQSQSTTYLGLIATLHTDGFVRVCAVDAIRSDTGFPTYFEVKRPAFEGRPPNTECSCFTWVSPTTIAAGCSNGYVVLWDLAKGRKVSNRSRSPPPTFYQPVHTTEIMSIASGYPSNPQLVSTSGLDGVMRLTDIRFPKADYSCPPRARVSCAPLAWHEQSQSFLSSDEINFLRNSQIRNFDSFLWTGKLDSNVLGIATSPVHATILVGTSEGTVNVFNPLRRVYVSKTEEQHGQIWFRHDYRQQSDSERKAATEGQTKVQVDTNMAEGPGSVVHGVSRFIQGYQVEEFDLQAPTDADYDITKRHKYQNFTTVFPEEVAVNCVAWNPNIECGGWATAGLGNGLVVVEDVCMG